MLGKSETYLNSYNFFNKRLDFRKRPCFDNLQALVRALVLSAAGYGRCCNTGKSETYPNSYNFLNKRPDFRSRLCFDNLQVLVRALVLYAVGSEILNTTGCGLLTLDDRIDCLTKLHYFSMRCSQQY